MVITFGTKYTNLYSYVEILFLFYRKDFQNLGPLETTLLYILHWIILDAADECIDDDGELNNPFYYLFSIPTITVSIFIINN
jgi:hypothetical protein